MQRKTDDKLILKMLEEGRTQKEIAEYFGVSAVAIHKRVKRLCPPPQSLENLTEKERNFAILKSQGKTNVEAVLSSYDVTSRESAKAFGSELMKRPEIEVAISDLLQHHGLTKSYRIGRLKDHVDNADPNVSLKAIDQSWKLDGSYSPERHVHLNFSYEDAVAELEEAVAQDKSTRENLKEQVANWREEGLSETEIIKRLTDDD
jgi:DNA-binding CsgD family transcriptional regulator